MRHLRAAEVDIGILSRGGAFTVTTEPRRHGGFAEGKILDIWASQRQIENNHGKV